jgi:hypothetical protein
MLNYSQTSRNFAKGLQMSDSEHAKKEVPLIDQAMDRLLQRIIKPSPTSPNREEALADAYLKLAQAKQVITQSSP